MAGAVRWMTDAVMSATTAAVDSLDVASGANDIIVVKQENGELSCTPFNVRFGKLKVIRRSDKYIFIEVNGERVPGLAMKLGDDGDAFWVAAAQGAVPDSAQTSPIQSPLASPRRSGALSSVAPMQSSHSLAHTGAALPPAAAPDIPAAAQVIAEAVKVDEDDGASSAARSEVVDTVAVIQQAALEDQSDLALVKENSMMRELRERLITVREAADQDGGMATPPPAPLTPAVPLHLAQSNEGGSPPALPADGAEPAPAFDLAHGRPAEAGPTWDPSERRRSSHVAAIPQLHSCWTLDGDRADDPASFTTPILPTDEQRGDSSGNRPPAAPPKSPEHEGQEPEPRTPLLSEDGDVADPVEAADGAHDVYTKTLYPTSEQLQRLQLRKGRNEVHFVTYSAYRGAQVVTCCAYLIDNDAQLVISDIDGTITRSDILGHVLPKIGKDWTHKGICSFYQRIRENGYFILYLSSRSISQIQGTRDFIFNIVQDGKRLPHGPVLMAPDRIFSALTREVVTRTPHEFKSKMLHCVKAAFPPEATPFYAGFGNRINDAWAYQHVGVHDNRIFIIDTSSNIHVVDKRVRMSTYGSLDALADQAFPPIGATKQVPAEFNVFLYWNLPPGSGLYEVPDVATPVNPLTSAQAEPHHASSASPTGPPRNAQGSPTAARTGSPSPRAASSPPGRGSPAGGGSPDHRGGYYAGPGVGWPAGAGAASPTGERDQGHGKWRTRLGDMFGRRSPPAQPVATTTLPVVPPVVTA
eukprot:TRINITY_DN25172_c0_g1_i1.p1 TRINITY_DN25172_c0_g1~~TRINITY_DN25172_c0_g1_i1.p1  ORF type:complete len:754 (+),score=156.93 TRINITY_DN25172_c0_g1_i1:85-2346(+)